MRKLVLYAGLGGCFLLALVLERLFTQPPRALGADSALVVLGGDAPRIEIPERPPEDLPPAKSSRPVSGGRGKRSDSGREDPPQGRASEPDPGPGAPPETELASKRRHRVQANESLWSLAERYLGSGADWPRLAADNGLSGPADLLTGMEIWVPSRAGSSAGERANEGGEDPGRRETSPAATPPIDPSKLRKYTVKTGDTLSEIAQRELGSAKLWRRICELNSLVGEQVEAGDVLLLPPRS